MPDLYYLTQKDRDLLNHLSTIFKGNITPNRHYDTPDDVPKSPDVYIALVPEAGIPAATDNAGTGEPGLVAGDKPGSAECDVYRIHDGELVVTGAKRLIYNLTSSVIPGGWIKAPREKFGAWVADVPSACAQRNEKWLIRLTNGATGGTFSLVLPINSVTETVTIDWDMTAAEVKTAFAVHSELVEADLNTQGGPFPASSVNVEFIGDQAGKAIMPEKITNALTGTNAGVDIFRWVPGFPN